MDIYLPGYPPKPEAIIDAITKLIQTTYRKMQEELQVGKHVNEGHYLTCDFCETRRHVFGVGRKPSINNHLIPSQYYKKFKSSKSQTQNTSNS
ncbi:hypothetical protein Lser_V15G20145 [Lactuca serriola]